MMDKDRAIELLKETIHHAIGGDCTCRRCITSEEEIINFLFTLDFTEEELINDLGYSEELIDRANALLN